MAVTVSRGKLLPFLADQAEAQSDGLDRDPNGLCLLVGKTAIRNLRSALVSRGIESDAVAQLETIQSAARQLSGRLSNPRVLPGSVKQELVSEIVDDARSGNAPESLQALVATVGDHWDDDRVEALLDELETYWRLTDAGSDHGRLGDVVETMDDPYASHRTRTTLSAFSALDTMMAERTDDLSAELYLSESHLVRDARDDVSTRWAEEYGHLDWIAVSSVKAMDNGVLRFFRELAAIPDGPDIHCFFNEGTVERMATRFEQVGIELADPPDSAHPAVRDRVDGLVSAASTGQAPETTVEDVSFVEAPDARRELEQVARKIDEQCADQDVGRSPSDFLVVVRETTPYQSTLADVFTSHGLPFHVESQRPVAQVIAYRMAKATVDLIAADATDAVVEYRDVVAPIRLGFCSPGDDADQWPVEDVAFLDIEERLHELQVRDGGPRTVEEWRQTVETVVDERGGPWHRVQRFLDWTGTQAATPPEDGSNLEMLLEGVVEAYVLRTAGGPVRPSSGPGVDTTRTDVGRKHQTHLARQAVLDGVAKVRQYYNYLVDLSLEQPGWPLAAQALGETLGQDQYSVPNRDGNAVRVVIPANTYFQETAHTYVVGLGADEFPTAAPRPTFLHERFFEAVWAFSETRSDPTAALLYAPSREETFQRELDDYEATVRTAQEHLTLSHHERNADGDEVAWSPFVDAVAAKREPEDRRYLRVRQGQWLPGPGWYGDWSATTSRAPMRDRLRLAIHHLREGVTGETFVPRLTNEAIADEGTLIRLLLSVDGEDYEAVGPGHRRFSTPLLRVTATADEVAFDGQHDLEALVGDPVRPHEIDLFTHCELKYYFYQYFFSRDGTAPARDSWPETESPVAADLYPTLPTLLGSHYAPESYRESMSAIVSDYLPDRQADLAAFDDVGELRAAFEEWRAADDRVDQSVFQTLVAEYLTVAAERNRGGEEADPDVHRTWSWIDGDDRTVTVDDHTVRLPPHRVDTIGQNDGARIPIFGSSRPGAGRVAVKNCWESPTNSTGIRGENADSVCRSCGKRDRCRVTTKGVLDSRTRVATVAEDTHGAMILDRFQSAPSGRQGFYRDDGRFEPVDHERYLDGLNGSDWQMRTKYWQRDLATIVDEMTPGDSRELTYEVDPAFVQNGGCEGCEFRDLCMVPSHFDEEGNA